VTQHKNSVSLLAVYQIILKSYRQTWFSLLMVCISLLIGCAGLSAVLIINQGAKASYTMKPVQALNQLKRPRKAKQFTQLIC